MQQRDWRRQVYRASRLDEYRAYMSGEMWNGDEYTAAEFIRRMTTFEETPAMAAGTAVHLAVERAPFGELPDHIDIKGWHIHFDLDAVVATPELREVELHREHNGIPLFGRCDAIDANSVHDLKTTSSIDVDRYLDSYQWRSYLWMSGRQRFVYDILRVKVDESIKVVTVLEYVPIEVTAYPRLASDVEGLLEQFHECVRSLGIGERLAA